MFRGETPFFIKHARVIFYLSYSVVIKWQFNTAWRDKKMVILTTKTNNGNKVLRVRPEITINARDIKSVKNTMNGCDVFMQDGSEVFVKNEKASNIINTLSEFGFTIELLPEWYFIYLNWEHFIWTLGLRPKLQPISFMG